ncbi:carbonic anhydrase [Pleurocapsa sp. FMAR1]|uniref:carbonic anhydrase n=1 Tax=Pleurocapsa sp. FMAR1 TaxID=3040204 RepID=UPI0029C809B1|nr:carbonic anhydrase family protein [Pleurocapsa sp. FMAR1]
MKKSKLWQRQLLAGAIFLTATLMIIVNPGLSLADENKPDWEYGGSNNPTHWSELSSEFKSCELGSNQSPINITTTQKGKAAAIEFDYHPSTVEVINNGHTIQANYEPGSTVKIDGQVYDLLQFHFHTPSEHEIEGKSAAMELHFVHKNKAGKLAVVGVMMDAGAENPLIASVWDDIPTDNKAEKGNKITLDAAKLLPKDKTFVSYSGSLTTPPCSEQVSWNILSKPIEVSSEQIETFESIYSYNARPIQPLNGRSVELHED